MKPKTNKPQLVINLDRDIHTLLKKHASIEGRTMRCMASHIIRSRFAPLLIAAQESLPPQRPRK